MEQLGALGIGIVTLAITLVVCFIIYAQTADNATVSADANASLAVSELTSATATIPDWVPIIVIVFVGVIILGLVRLFNNNR